MARGYTLNYDTLKGDYNDFWSPVAKVTIEGKKIKGYEVIGDLQIDLTSDFPASTASFILANGGVYSLQQYENGMKSLGKSVEISLGYEGGKEKIVFWGILVAIEFFSTSYSTEGISGLKMTAMDVKGMMMANSYAKQIQAKSYAEVVKKILEKYKDAYQELIIEQTPDQQTEAVMIPMVSESDYEFVVKAAKKWNFEFFTDGGTVIFRKAKSDADKLIQLKIGESLLQFSIEYAINGLANQIEVRSVNTGTAKVVLKREKNIATSMKLGKAANEFFKKSQRVYIDPTVGTKEDAGRRAEALKETMQYQFGTLNGVCRGIPDLVPGSWIAVEDATTKTTAEFYLTEVKHVFNEFVGYETRIKAKSAQKPNWKKT